MITGFLNNLTGGNQESVESVVQHIVSHSGSSASLAQLASWLKSKDSLLGRNRAALAQPLDTLNPAAYSLGYLFLLATQAPSSQTTAAQAAPAAPADFRTRVTAFCQAAVPEQIRLAPDKFVQVVQEALNQLFSLGEYKAAVSLSRTAISKLVPSSEYITPLHADFFRACLQAKSYRAAVPLLSDLPENVDPSKTAMTPRAFLLYCYYGGLIHIGRRRYVNAMRLLLYALTAPTLVVNAITMAAHKKYILVSLIQHGALTSLPKFVPASVSRATKYESAAYLELAAAYGAKDDQQWNRLVEQNRTNIQQDGNWGLLQLASESRTVRRIQRLTQTYLTLSLQDIAGTACLESRHEAERHILRMIDSGEIFAEIDQTAGMVRFLEDPQEFDDAETARGLDEQVQRAHHLSNKLKLLNHEVACDKAYLSKVAASKERRGQGTSVLEDPGGMSIPLPEYAVAQMTP